MSATLASPLLFGVVVIGEAAVGLALLFGVVVIEEAVVGLDCVVDFGLAPPTLRSRMEFLKLRNKIAIKIELDRNILTHVTLQFDKKMTVKLKKCKQNCVKKKTHKELVFKITYYISGSERSEYDFYT